MTDVPTIAKALTIAGSDSGGGAGIQADLKTFAALGVYGTSVITTVTAQNTVEVSSVHIVPPRIVASQIDAVLSDIGANAVKTGMLFSAATIRVVATKLVTYGVDRLVVDPVMVSKSGDRLLREDSVDALKTHLLPLATVVTPNIPEAEVLADMKILSSDDVVRAARCIVDQGAAAVVIKGGHLEGDAVDCLYDGHDFKEFSVPRVETINTHGTGCTLASGIAAGLAKGLTLAESVSEAKCFVTEALHHSYQVGHGHGPLNHQVRRRVQ